MGLQLTAADVAALEGRTEGWIAALQLAALSMQGRDDVAGFIAGFAGDARYVVDYLVEEVLAPAARPMSRASCCRPRSSTGSAARCAMPSPGDSGGKAMLESLERANLFLVPLDDRRRWYRYHHLFADVLRARLLDEQPDIVPVLHRRASAWYEENGERAVAIDHALAGRGLRPRGGPRRAGGPGSAAAPAGGDAATLDGGSSRLRSSGTGRC